MKTQIMKTSCAAAFALVVGLASARAEKDADAHYKLMDANGDGQVTRAEHNAAAKKLFTECDANQDGTVTAAEMDAHAAKRGDKLSTTDMTSAEKIKQIDQNADGKLTTAEHAKGSDDMFTKTDKDGNGTLSKAECDEAMKTMKRGA